jgi:phospholipase/carboxylesterase
MLHGVRSNEQDLLGLASLLDDRFFAVSVRAPITMGPAAYAWYHVDFLADGYRIDVDEAERSRILLLEFTRELTQAYKVDAERVFLMGFSQGAVMSLLAALTEPQRFAGIVGMSGRLIEEATVSFASPERMTGLPVMVVHGVHDSVIPIRHGRAVRDTLAVLPVALTYREYDMAHEVTEHSIRDIAQWLTGQLESSSDWRRRGE